MVYNNIKKNHQHIKGYINKHKTLKLRKLNTKSTITFLIKCRNTGIIPNFLNNSTKNIHNIFKTREMLPTKIYSVLNTLLENFHRKLLNLLIRQKHEVEKYNKKEIEVLENKINKHLTTEEQEELWISENALTTKRNTIIKNKHRQKFEKLRELQRKEFNIIQNDKWFVNKTNTTIPDDVQWLLSLGQKHTIPTNKRQFPLFKLIADGEDCIQTLIDKEDQEIARTKLTSMLENHMNKHSLTMRDRFVLNTVEQTRTFLHKNKNILILNADKGNVTVAMEKEDYESRMNDVLNDMMTYRRINKDPTSSLQKKNSELVDELHNLNIITVIEKRRMKNDAAFAPRIYGLPKIHKEGFPLRPICASVNSPSSELCKFIMNILKQLTVESEFNIRDAVQFRDKINNCDIDKEDRLVSFDVISLFPSIPVDFAIDVIRDKWDEIEKHTTMSKELFMKILKFCIKDNRYFKYKEKIYTQCKGLPMGSPASPIVADIVMEELLKQCVNKLHKKPKLLTKYVDDLFGIIEECAIIETLDVLNSFHKQIKFTIEEEKDGRLPYLDTLVIRAEGKIKIDWYQKPTASGRIINYHSCQPNNIVMNTASNFIRRVLTISDRCFHTENIYKIKDILRKNSFPDNIIRRLLDNHKKNRELIDEMPKIYKAMTYVPGISERIKKSEIYNKEKYKIAPRTDNTLKQLFSNTKSKIDKMEKANVIYKINCTGDVTNTCKQVYVGTTKNKLKTRLAGHRSDLKNRNKQLNQKTALAAHCALNGHTPDLDNVEILQREEKYNRRFTLEVLHIINIEKERRMNFKSDVEHCAQSYRHIINKTKIIN